MPNEEKVLCFKRSLFDDIGTFHGLSLDIEKYLPVITSPQNVAFIERSKAELDKNYKQIIPYVLIIFGDKILRYQRGKKGGETRLHGFYSVGIGGHISSEDNDLFSSPTGYREGMRRELLEEVDVDGINDAAVAIINDDSTDVGQVHLGIVHILFVSEENVATRRVGINSPEFIPWTNAIRETDKYETWSRFCLENLRLLLAKAGDLKIESAENAIK